MIAAFLFSLPFLLLLIALIGVVLFLHYGRNDGRDHGSNYGRAVLPNKPPQLQLEQLQTDILPRTGSS
jgi:hypothetical protein